MILFNLNRFVQALDRRDCTALSQFRSERKLLGALLHIQLAGSYAVMVLNHGQPYYMALAVLFTLSFLLYIVGAAVLINTARWPHLLSSSECVFTFAKLKEKHGDNVLPKNSSRPWLMADYLVAKRYDEKQSAKLSESLRESEYNRLKGSK